jgi:hypothetical protein
MASIRFEFDTLQNLVEQLTTFVCHATRKAEQVEPCQVGEPKPETAPKAEERKTEERKTEEAKAEEAKADEPKRRGRPPKTEAQAVESVTDDKSRAAALVEIVAAIRSFVIADKAGNMRKLIPLMPAGKKSLDALELEEAQRIVLALGIEV